MTDAHLRDFVDRVADRAFYATEQDFTVDTIAAAVERAVDELTSAGWRVVQPERAELVDALTAWVDALDSAPLDAVLKDRGARSE